MKFEGLKLGKVHILGFPKEIWRWYCGVGLWEWADSRHVSGTVEVIGVSWEDK